MAWFEFDGLGVLGSLLVSLAVQATFFALAARLRTDVFTDITYSLTFALLGLWMLLAAGPLSPARILPVALVLIWSARLGAYLLRRILHMRRDVRFDGIREHPLRFGLFWLVQGLTIWLVLLPVTVLLHRGDPPLVAWAAGIGAGLWLVGFAIEAVADQQKFRFKKSAAGRDDFIRSGLWRYARHPNYFGEMLCWWGLFVMAVPALSGWSWAAVLGPVALTGLLLFGTGIPTVAKRQRERYGHLPAYREWVARTSLLVPWFPKRSP